MSVPLSDPLPDLTESIELLRRYQEGDREALNALLTRYRARVERIVSVRMGVKLRRFLQPEDLVQDTLATAARKLGELQPRSHSSILRWLSRVAENQIRDRLDYYGAMRRSPPGAATVLRLKAPGSGSNSGADVADGGPSPSDVVRQRELQSLLDDAVSQLQPESFRRVVIERDYVGATWEEVRIALDKPSVEATQDLHRRAHIKLRRVLRPYLGGEA